MTWAIVRSWILPLTVGLAVAASSPRLPAKDYFLTIGGGYSPSGNQASLERNVHFNGPRAGLNFNNQMGGGDITEGNLLANCVHESGNHGPYLSWDPRAPTSPRTG